MDRDIEKGSTVLQ